MFSDRVHWNQMQRQCEGLGEEGTCEGDDSDWLQADEI